MADSANRDTRPSRPRPMHRRSRPTDGNGEVKIDRELLAELDREEPLSLAEELDKAAERVRRIGAAIAKDDAHDRNIHIAELQRMTMPELIATGRSENLAEISGLKKQDLIFRILKERVKLNGLMFGEGTLEILPDGFGFLRSPDYHYLSCPDDIYVSPSQIRRFGLRNGNTVAGTIRPPKENERYFALLRVEAINYEDPNLLARKDLLRRSDAAASRQAASSWKRRPNEVEMRVVDMIVPIGFGQRGLIVSPPRAGKTILLQKMAKSVLTNYPDAYVIMLLIDERPEEVTDMERQVKGPNCEVISSTFDEPSARHIQVSEMVIEKAKRMVEYGQRRDDLPRFDHPPGPGLELRMPALGQNPLRRHRRQRHAAAQAVLRLGPQGRRRRLADDHRHGPGRHRQQDGRGDLRGVQRHRQPGNRARPPAGRPPHLAGHRHQPQRHAQGRDADGPRRTPPRLHPPPRAQRHEPPRRHGAARHPPAKDQDQRRIPDEHEGVRNCRI